MWQDMKISLQDKLLTIQSERKLSFALRNNNASKWLVYVKQLSGAGRSMHSRQRFNTYSTVMDGR